MIGCDDVGDVGEDTGKGQTGQEDTGSGGEAVNCDVPDAGLQPYTFTAMGSGFDDDEGAVVYVKTSISVEGGMLLSTLMEVLT